MPLRETKGWDDLAGAHERAESGNADSRVRIPLRALVITLKSASRNHAGSTMITIDMSASRTRMILATETQSTKVERRIVGVGMTATTA